MIINLNVTESHCGAAHYYPVSSFDVIITTAVKSRCILVELRSWIDWQTCLGWPLFCPQNCPLRVWISTPHLIARTASGLVQPLAGLIVVTRQIIIMFIWHNQAQKYVPNCDVSFANGELHQAYGHVTLTNAWPKYGHMSLVGCRLPRLCSYMNRDEVHIIALGCVTWI